MAAPTQPVWDAHRRAEHLIGRRDVLVRRLPARFPVARRFMPDLRELIVDDAIEFTALRHDRPVPTASDLERVFWKAAENRVKQAADGRHETVRAGHIRVEAEILDVVHDQGDGDPARLVEAAANSALAREFMAGLDAREQLLVRARCDAGGPEPAGYKVVARVLDWPVGEVRAVQARVEQKLERFAAIQSAGRMCAFRAPAIAATAAGEATERESAVAHAHLESCPPCTLDYVRQLRYLRSARFQDQVGQLLPPITVTAGERRTRTGVRDLLADWAARVLGHDAPASALHATVSGAGRGLGTAAALKLAALCTGSALTACVATGVLPLPAINRAPTPTPTPAATATPTPMSTPVRREPRLPHGAINPTPTPTPKPKRRPRRTTTAGQSPATQGGTGARSHEQRPASAAPPNAAPGGASEFDPTFQPSAPTQPAPVPAAPGASEFG